MSKDVYVFGDSHWRVFFPFVNHGSPGVKHTQDGITTIDMVANELSGTTMYGLLNPNSRHHGRQRILGDLDRIGPVDNVGLAFGEVDARYHNARYFIDGKISRGRIYELVSRYIRFIQEDLQMTGRVKKNVFVYHGFAYPKKENTLLQPGQPIGDSWRNAQSVNVSVLDILEDIFDNISGVTLISNRNPIVSDDGVHLVPEKTYPYVLKVMKWVLEAPQSSELEP